MLFRSTVRFEADASAYRVQTRIPYYVAVARKTSLICQPKIWRQESKEREKVDVIEVIILH